MVRTNRDIPHHRKLEISFSNGVLLRVRFDQGVGYWRLEGATNFEFSEDSGWLVDDVGKRMSAIKIRSVESWATDITVELVNI